MPLRAPISLRRRLILQISFMIVCCLLLGAGALWGISGLQQDFGIALRGYQQLQDVDRIGFHVATAKDALRGQNPNRAKALSEIRTAADALELLTWSGESAEARGLRDSLRAAVAALDVPAAAVEFGSNLDEQRGAVDAVLGRLLNLSAAIRTTIKQTQESAAMARRWTLGATLGLCAVVVAAAVIIGRRQYRSVVAPLDRLAQGVRRIAAGQFTDRLQPLGDREFIALADDFNAMAQRLDVLYRDLEGQVRAKSNELVRSERLASVGYLAAGVAHEINNPLSIIAGYAERTLLELEGRQPLDTAAVERVRGALGIVCDEAFRCKQITDRLLSLSRPGSGEAARVSLGALAREVIANVTGVRPDAAAKIFFEGPNDASVMGREGELKQVVLNLVLNALEALAGNDGRVDVSVAARGDEVELRVRDNGRGMSASTLERVFEPFYSEKRGERPGTGLGLSITYAIVQDHGGRIEAASDGPGKGSVFSVILPAAP